MTGPLNAAEPQAPEADQSLPRVVIETTEGNIELTLRPDVAPETVSNFLAYAEADFYQGTIFHRVIPGFMIQGGGFSENLERKQTRDPVPLEAKPTVKNLRGTIAMARTGDPDSATSQFFINLVDNDYLNAGARGPGYTVFGKVTSGMGVVDTIAGKATGRRNGMADVPREPVIIKDIRRLGS
ncbi:MAG: peptidylprolyl isomerase [Marinobacter sp.]|uniref:peptidylprolyl isomerase n=1 Tax=Marinobacter sp. TaxID=50741 RepID=UPI00299D63A5|nr:peptidylprolyl isomerase [Marinobacter sp.]MDX1634269.1 peptidylprolyl isomerase [Marinobacter sp.]